MYNKKFPATLCIYIFKHCPSQFLNHLESAEPVFWSEELSFFSLQKPKQTPDSQFWAEKFKFCCMLRIIHR